MASCKHSGNWPPCFFLYLLQIVSKHVTHLVTPHRDMTLQKVIIMEKLDHFLGFRNQASHDQPYTEYKTSSYVCHAGSRRFLCIKARNGDFLEVCELRRLQLCLLTQTLPCPLKFRFMQAPDKTIIADSSLHNHAHITWHHMHSHGNTRNSHL